MQVTRVQVARVQVTRVQVTRVQVARVQVTRVQVARAAHLGGGDRHPRVPRGEAVERLGGEASCRPPHSGWELFREAFLGKGEGGGGGGGGEGSARSAAVLLRWLSVRQDATGLAAWPAA